MDNNVEAEALEIVDLLTALVTLQYHHEHREAWRCIQDCDQATAYALLFAATAALVDAFNAQQSVAGISLS